MRFNFFILQLENEINLHKKKTCGGGDLIKIKNHKKNIINSFISDYNFFPVLII